MTITAPSADRAAPAAAPGRLRICVIGYAGSVHVVARARCFADMGHEVHLLTEVRARAIEGVTQHVPGIEPTRAGRLARRLLAPLLAALGIPPLLAFQLAGLAWFLARRRPDVIHVHYAHGPYGWFAAALGARPLVVSVMGGDVLFDEQGSHTPTTRWLTLQLLRRADFITSKSHYLTAVLDRLGGFGAKAERVIWGVPLGRFRRTDASALGRRLGLAAERRVILSPRLLQPLYRVHLLVEAMPAIVREVPGALLLVTEYGADPAYREQLVARVAQLGLGTAVRFCGEVAHDEMPMLYSLAEVSAGIPSSDGLPQTLLEAMACGTPNLVSRLARYEELVRHGESAWFVDADPLSIADAVVRLLRDGELRATLARNALAIVAREGDLDRSARRVLERYRELAATVPARALSPRAFWSALRDYRRFRSTPAA